MSAYNPNIPQGTDFLDQSYAQIQGNFAQANTSFGVDHLPFTDGTALNGFHTVVHLKAFSTVAAFPPNNYPAVLPAPNASAGEIFACQVNDGINTDTSLYYQSGFGRSTQLTRNFVPTIGANGASFLPGGLILNWGRVTLNKNSSNPTTITFTQKYASAATVYSITLGYISTDTGTTAQTAFIDPVSIMDTQFQVNNTSSSSGRELFWMAIGI